MSAAGVSPAPEAGVLANKTSMTTQEKARDGSPPRLEIAETYALSQEAVNLYHERVHTCSQSRSPSKTSLATPSKSMPK